MSKGLVDLALNTAIASEMHNILLGQGLPWIVYNLVYGKPIEFEINGLYFFTLAFLCSFLILFVIAFKVNSSRLNAKFAYILIIIYCIFLVLLFYLSFIIKFE
jgi:Ca2+/Na+ antiporter